MTSGVEPAPAQRLTSLDGLRGIAAVVVLLHHALLTSAALAQPYSTPGSGEGLAWVLTYTPLHLVWAGTEAVTVFFVLSGFVLTLPFLRSGRPRWLAYYPQRLIRLYLPIWGAVVLAVVIAVTVDRSPVTGASWWLNAHTNLTAEGVGRGLTLLFGGDFAVNSALWSLQWEILFSLLLPVFLLAASLARRLLLVKIAVILAVVAIGSSADEPAAIHLPAFAAGVLMAVERERMRAIAERLTRRWQWIVLAGAAVLLLIAYWLVLGVAKPSGGVVALSLSARLVGAALAVFLFAYWRPAIALADSRVCGWLGQRSFSLYLVHEPIVVAVGFLSGGRLGVVLLLACAASLLAAEAFYRSVERPGHDLARAVGRRIERSGRVLTA